MKHSLRIALTLGLLATLALGRFTIDAFAANEVVPIGDSVLNQASQARAVVKSDATVLPQTRGIFMGEATACDVALILAGDTAAVTFKNVASGTWMPVSAIKIMNTNTTCANASLIALY